MFADILKDAYSRLEDLEFETNRKLAILHKGWSCGYPKKPRPKQPFPPVIEPLPMDVLFIKQRQKVFIEEWNVALQEWRPSELNWHAGFLSLNASEARRRQRELCEETLLKVHENALLKDDKNRVVGLRDIRRYRIREIF